MTNNNQKQLGNALWRIADQQRRAMDADDFRDYMLACSAFVAGGRVIATAARQRTGAQTRLVWNHAALFTGRA